MEDDLLNIRLRFAQWQVMPGDIDDEGYAMSPYPDPLDAKFDALSTLYLEEKQLQLGEYLTRDEGSARLEKPRYTRFDNIVIYMRRLSKRIRSIADSSLLRLGLAAAALGQGGLYYNDFLISLAFLYYAAVRVEVDPAPYFEEAMAGAAPRLKEALCAFLTCDPSSVRRIIRYHEGTG